MRKRCGVLKILYLLFLTGTCSRKVRRFYYNSQLKKCLPFTYKGCKGNQNRFMTLEDCHHTCEVAPSSGQSSLVKSGSVSSNYIIIEVVVGFMVVMLLTIGFVLGVKYYKLYRYFLLIFIRN